MTRLFQLLGVIVLAVSALELQLIWQNAQTRATGGRDLSDFIYFVAAEVPIGIGLLFARRWAALLFSVALSALGIAWLGHAFFGTGGGRLVALVGGCVLQIPCILTLRCWKELRPAGRFWL